MSIGIGNYANIYTPATTKQTYIDKYDKSLKLPFLNVLNNNLPNGNAAQGSEPVVDYTIGEVSDKVELNYAVVGSSAVK